MKTFLDILLIITSIALMALILLHRGKGGGLSSLKLDLNRVPQ